MAGVIVDGDSITQVVVTTTPTSSTVVQGDNGTQAIVQTAPSVAAVVSGALIGPQGKPGLMQSVQPGANIVVDATDPANPIVSATATPLSLKDEGSTLTSTPSSINFVGAGVAATHTGNDVTVTVDATPPPDASPTVKGLVQLAGDLGGTATSPTVPGLSGKQPLDSDLTTIAALNSATSGMIASDGAGWIQKTYAQVKTALALVKGDVGLGSVDNTSDATKNVLSATKLTTGRTIDGITFDGSANIAVVAPATHAATSKTTPVDADELPLADSAASFGLAKLTWANLKAAIKSYYDSVSTTMTNKTLTSPVINTGTVGADPTVALGVASKQYVDNQATSSSIVTGETPTPTPNGSATVFTLASVYTTNSVEVFRNGVRMTRGVDFTETSPTAKTITFTTAPLTGDTIRVNYTVSAAGYSVGTNSDIRGEVPTGSVNGTNTSFTVLHNAYIASSLAVYLDGILQRRGTDYTETTPASGIFTMVTAPLTGQSIQVNYQFNLNPSSNADTVDGIHASSTATAGQLMPLDGNAKVNTNLLYNPYKFSVYLAANTAVASLAAVPFANAEYDTGSNVDLVTNKGRFTAPVAGFYSFNATVYLSNFSTSGFGTVYLYKNGAVAKRGVSINYTTGSDIQIVVTATVQLAAGDYVDVRPSYAGSVTTLGSQNSTYFQGYLVSAT